MKSKLTLLLLLLGVMTNASAHTSRIYFEPHQVHINDAGIFLEIAESLYQVAGVRQDAQGFYTSYAMFWKKCPYNHPNPPERVNCQICGVPLDMNYPPPEGMRP